MHFYQIRRRSGLGRPVALLFCLVMAGGIAHAAENRVSVQGSASVATPCDSCLPGVSNFAKISDALWRGAQPTAEGFQALEAQGVKTVINFRHDHDDLPLLKGTHIKYLHIPSFAFHPTKEHLVTFLKVMEDKNNWPVYIHCAQGRDRTGYNAATYRMVEQGWTMNDAILEMNVFHFNKIWVGNPGFLKTLSADELREKVKQAPKPAFVSWRE